MINQVQDKITKELFPQKERDRLQNNERQRRYRERKKLKQFNISQSVFESMKNSQNNTCAICNNPETRLYKKTTLMPLSLDHDHATGKVRKLLCSRCNLTLGKCRDDIKLLTAMIDYLRGFSNAG